MYASYGVSSSKAPWPTKATRIDRRHDYLAPGFEKKVVNQKKPEKKKFTNDLKRPLFVNIQ